MVSYLKKDDRKRQIKVAALKLFGERGYRNTSVQDILDEIGYSKGGFYNCYDSKEALFRDIIDDGMDYRFAELRRYKEKMKDLDRETLLIEALLDKLLDDNPYKKLFVSLVMELDESDELKKLYMENIEILTQSFIDFCEREGFEEYIKISSAEFGIFINSLILGANVFGVCGSQEYRDILRVIIRAYFKEMGLIR